MSDQTIGQDVPVMDVKADFHEHHWTQQGNELQCVHGCELIATTNASAHGARITPGLMLKGARGSFELVPEGADVRDEEGYATAQRLAQEAMA